MRSHTDKADRIASKALSAFDGIVSGLNEANRLLDVEQVKAREARDFHRAEVQRHAEIARAAIDAQHRNGRVLDRIVDLIS
jgi:hypothetical protein